MATIIRKIRLMNFKRFTDYTIEPNARMNILVGDNEVGKSSVLEAIDLVANGNVRRVESIGLDRLLNIDAIEKFFSGERNFNNLPQLRIELYLTGDFDFTMRGENNMDHRDCDGIRLVCEPNEDYATEIADILKEYEDYFPYEYYKIRFSTFADEGYSGYKKKLRSAVINNSNMNTENAMNDFVKRMYFQYTESDAKERATHKRQYRMMRENFDLKGLETLNARVPATENYSFGLKKGSAMDLDGDLMIYEEKIGIDSKGTGRQVFVKTNFALERAGENVDVILIEEPENHLSPVNLKNLIHIVAETSNGQLFITTHNSMICTRLEIKNLQIMNGNEGRRPTKLQDLEDDTAKYFMKTPPASIVEYSLSSKSILVEGPSEYMLMEDFFKTVTGHTPEEENVHIIDVRGLSFKRYLEIAKLTDSKVAVLTDNDRDVQKNCVNKYANFDADANIGIFYEQDGSKHTFEIALYGENQELCDSLFGDNSQEFMLNNKTESAYRLLIQDHSLAVPDYIKRAINWISE